MTRHRVFQPVLVRPGQATRHGLAAAVALSSWQASQLWTPELRSRWLVQPTPIVNIRCAHLGDFQKASALDGWAGSSTAVAGPLMTLATAPREVVRAKTDGWTPWGTTEPPTAKVTIVVNSDIADIRSFCSIAAVLLQRCIGYAGQPVTVESRPLPQRAFGDVLLG